MTYLDTSKISVLNSDLAYPEGPVYCRDGSVLLVEIKGQCLTRILPSGERHVVADLPGGPNGAAIGPDIDGEPTVYVCNNGGMQWIPYPPPPSDPPPQGWAPKLWVSGPQPADYETGKLQSVGLASGTARDLFTETTIPPAYPPLPFTRWDPPFSLRGPDDLVVDREGGMWISDFGKQRARDWDVTGVYYMSPDRSTLRQAVYPLNSPNGIALSPDGEWLYVALSYERRIVKYRVGPNGSFLPNPKTLDGSYCVTGALPGISVLDSMAVDCEGNLYVATMIPEGYDPTVTGGITVISPDGGDVEFIPITLPDGQPCPLPSNICFGGDDLRTAYVTCGGTGHLISMPSAIAGLELNFTC
jgi:gluconolactonase